MRVLAVGMFGVLDGSRVLGFWVEDGSRVLGLGAQDGLRVLRALALKGKGFKGLG